MNLHSITPEEAHKEIASNVLDFNPKVGDLVRVYKTNNAKAIIGCLGVIVGEIGVKTMELKVVFEPKFPVSVRDGVLRAEGSFSEYINTSELFQYKYKSSYKPEIKNFVNFSHYTQELIMVKQLYTAIN
tara:strand:- start:4356 stop:4742 length:387 start_codon:yes stop_codon:yes gene_type:complete